MILRNSLKSVLRSPVKSILFFILILSLTTALTLGSALVGMCSMLIEECDRTYITEGSLEYRGGRFPFKAVTDAQAYALRQKTDLDAIAALPYVENIDSSRTVIASVPDYPTILSDTSAQNAFVGVIRRVGTADKAYNVLYADIVINNSVVRTDKREGNGEFYLVTGFTDGKAAGVINISIGDIINEAGTAMGLVQEYNCIDVSDDPDLQNGDPRYEFFFRAAEIYTKINSSSYAVVSGDPGFLEPFVEKEYAFKDGSLWTAEDLETRGTCCILPTFIANRMGIKAGDTTTLEITSTDYSTIIDSVWYGPEGDSRVIRLECYVSGVFSTTSDEKPLIYLSDCGENISEEEITGFCGYTLATLKLKNGITSEQIKEIKSLLPEGVDLAIRDQGYSVIVEMLSKLRMDALGVTAAALVATLVMLVLFGYVFVGRQSESLVTMYMMGTPKGSLAAYVIIASGTVLVPAGVCGCATASLFSDFLISFITKTIEQGQSVLKLYSTASLGTVNYIEVNITMPVWPGLVCAAGVIGAGLISCLAFLRFAVGKIGAKVKEKTVKKARKQRLPASAKPLNISGAGLKYFILSFIRGGLRSIVIPLIGFLMTLFVLVPAGAITVYENRLKQLEESTVIKGYLTDYGGKKSYDLVFNDGMLDRLMDGDYFSDFHLSMNDPYRVCYVTRSETGETVKVAEDKVEGGFAGENFLTNFLNGPKMYYTDNVGYTPEFFSAREPEITYLEGYGDDWFENTSSPFKGLQSRWQSSGETYFYFEKDLRELCVVVSDSFLEQYGLKLGDSITVDISIDMVTETYLIIGSFRPVSSGDTMYTRITNSPKIIKAGYDKLGTTIYSAKLRGGYSCCTFRLTDTSKIVEAKEWLRDKGFSRVHSAGFYRLYPVLVDAEYCESVEKIEKNIGYLKNIVPALSVLVGIAGFAASVLMAYRRRVEIATLRSIGQKDFSVFLLFLTEQLLPCVFGVAAGTLLFMLFAEINGYSLYAISFIAGFSAGSLISLLRMSKTNLLDVLSDKE